MVKLYESNGCPSCRKAKVFMKEHGIPFQSINISNRTLSYEEIRHLLQISEDVYDVISVRSQPYQDFKKQHGFPIEDLRLSHLIVWLQNNPTALKRPLIVKDDLLISGYDDDEITILLPPEKRLCGNSHPYMDQLFSGLQRRN